MRAMAPTYEVAAIDLPGFNASAKPTTRHAVLTQNVCRAVAGALAALGRESCLLVGHDWGAIIAYDFAAMYPAKVQTVSLHVIPR
jgi:epoxide hydrolase 4